MAQQQRGDRLPEVDVAPAMPADDGQRERRRATWRRHYAAPEPDAPANPHARPRRPAGQPARRRNRGRIQ